MVQIRVSPETKIFLPPILLGMGKNIAGSGGIRTHAPEETGALNQRLRPLGHATLIKDACLSQFSICVQPIYSAAMFLYGWATFLKRDQLQ